jgi:peptidoglycan hydrolase-like protein with peptidoglycan-binding domain
LKALVGDAMAKIASRVIVSLGAALALLAPVGVSAQTTPPMPPPAPAAAAAPVDPVLAAQKAAFDAMPEADRKAIQEALVWSGLYVGVVDGAFGRRTRDAILAWQASVKATATGTIDAAQLSALKADLQKERAAVGFQTFIDARTGVRIGAPLKILDKRSQNGADAILSKADGSVTLGLRAISGDLAALYAQLSADAPGRKITYKASKPDAFFVVSGEEAGRKFYTRIARAPATAPDPTALRGFTFIYPTAQSAVFDRITLAIADSFDPFPTTGAVVGNVPTPVPSPTPSGPALAATGFVVAPGQAVSAIGAADCAEPTIDGKAAKFLREDKQVGLSLISGDFGAGAAAPPFGAIGADMVALSYAQEKPGAPSLIVAPASPLSAGDSSPQVLAPLPKSGAGSPLFDRKGDLVAIVAQSSAEPRKVGGVAALAAHRALDAEMLRNFLAIKADAPENNAPLLSAGQVAAARRSAVVAIYCRR